MKTALEILRELVRLEDVVRELHSQETPLTLSQWTEKHADYLENYPKAWKDAQEYINRADEMRRLLDRWNK